MRRYWVEKESLQDGTVILSGDSYHHIVHVCRMREGSKFEVLVEGGKAYFVEMKEVGKKQARALILESRDIRPLPKPHLNIALCVPRFNVLESVLEKAVELGVARIALLFSDFSFVKKGSSIPAKKMERWQKIIVSSTQQTGRGELMELTPAVPLKDFMESFNPDGPSTGLFAYEGDGVLSLKEALAKESARASEELWTFVGGEGGFSDAEVELFGQKGLQPITLGEQVLRVETACTTLISIIKYDLDLMR